MRARWRYILVAVVFGLQACSSSETGGDAAAATRRAAETVPVTVGAVVRKDVPVQVHAIGNVEAYSTVIVKSQVQGQVSEVHFEEGQRVQKGDLLFTIDPRPFEAALHQAEANLAKDSIQAKNAQVEAHRQDRLLNQGFVSRNEYDTAQTQAAALQAAVKADHAAVENAKLQLQYCFIHSPIDGRIGQILVHAGNVVKDNDTTLAVINQIRPAYVSFSVPEQNLPQIRERNAAGQLPVYAYVGHETHDSIAGTLSFINNTVDTTTGTVLLKGLFPNENETLWPGQFVDVAVTLSVQHDALVVPNQAIEQGQQGPYVYVVGPDMTVTLQPVVMGERAGAHTVITKGLLAGQQVVTDGQVRLAPGARVEIKNTPAGANKAETVPAVEG